MRAITFVVFMLVLQLSANVSIDDKISKTENHLKSFDLEYDIVNKKMAKNAKEIIKQQKIIYDQQKRLKELSADLSNKSEVYSENKKELSVLEKEQLKLLTKQHLIEHELIDTIAKNVSISEVLKKEHVYNERELITEEVLKQIRKMTHEEIKSLNSHFEQYAQKIDVLDSKTKALKDSINEIDKKRLELATTKKKNERSLKHMRKKKKEYKNMLARLLKQQEELQKTLAELNIIKVEESERAKEMAEQKDRRKRLQAMKTTNEDLPEVRQLGSSYQKVSTKRYSGRKTIAPLDAYTLTKKYGTYTDPIYGIKIFNESVSLKPKTRKAKVKNVLNGKVILAKKTAMLENVIIIEHDNGLHTIYAYLDKIAPTIKKGTRVRKGYTIGRVDDELMFEVTQKNYHIDPMELIR